MNNSKQRSSRCGGAGVGYLGRECKLCHKPLSKGEERYCSVGTVCVACIRRVIKNVIEQRE